MLWIQPSVNEIDTYIPSFRKFPDGEKFRLLQVTLSPRDTCRSLCNGRHGCRIPLDFARALLPVAGSENARNPHFY
jgi:hypothetical protein